MQHFDILPGFLKKEREKKIKFISPALLIVIKTEWGALFDRSKGSCEIEKLLNINAVHRTDNNWLGDGCRCPSGISNCPDNRSPPAFMSPACCLDIHWENPLDDTSHLGGAHHELSAVSGTCPCLTLTLQNISVLPELGVRKDHHKAAGKPTGSFLPP